MCKMYGVVTDQEAIRNKISSIEPLGDKFKHYIIRVGEKAPVITDSDPNIIQHFTFGLTASSSIRQTSIYNAEASHMLFKSPFRILIRTKRCVVPATHFITVNPKSNQAYCVHLIKDKPFFFAGVWDSWKDERNNIIMNSFSLITTKSNSIMSSFSFIESPVILGSGKERVWLKNDAPLSRITPLLQTIPIDRMDFYPINSELLKNRDIEVGLLKPTSLSYWQIQKRIEMAGDQKRIAEIQKSEQEQADRQARQVPMTLKTRK